MKKGVLIMAYGSPDKTEDIEPYYTDIRRGSRPSAAQLEELTGRYNAIGGSPLLKITSEQAMKIQNELGTDYQVFMGMRHWKPWILDAVDSMRKNDITEAVGVVMAPHYSSMSIEKYIGKVEEAKSQLNYGLEVKYVRSWHDHPLFIEALHQKIVKALKLFSEKELKELHIIFTAHSLPEKILEQKDPYKDQLLETCSLLAKKDHIKQWSFAFQSAGRTQEKWLGPDLTDEIDHLHSKGAKSILVCSIGFITDHLEVLYDIDIEGKNHAKKLGMHLERTESLNADILLARLLAELIKKKN
jgi:protoporphyrin/coproporphyrin ferrochelatase